MISQPEPATAEWYHLMAALDTLRAAGFAVQAPAWARMASLSTSEVAQLLSVGPDGARGVMRQLPGTYTMPSGDLRCLAADLAAWQAQRRLERPAVARAA
jgi:hypothetical protein